MAFAKVTGQEKSWGEEERAAEEAGVVGPTQRETRIAVPGSAESGRGPGKMLVSHWCGGAAAVLLAWNIKSLTPSIT